MYQMTADGANELMQIPTYLLEILKMKTKSLLKCHQLNTKIIDVLIFRATI